MVRMTGALGRLEWGYAPAAQLRDYTVIGDAAGWTLTATPTAVDPYKVQQRPLVFVAPSRVGDWRWPVLMVEIADGRLQAQLGPPLES